MKSKQKVLISLYMLKGFNFCQVGKNRSIVDDSSEIHYSILKNMKDFFFSTGRTNNTSFFSSILWQMKKIDGIGYVEKVEAGTSLLYLLLQYKKVCTAVLEILRI